MQIKFVDDPSVQAAPAGFQNALNEAASVISAKLINDPITVTLDIGYGEVGGSPITGSVLAAAAPTRGTFLTYDQLVSDLHNQALSANDRTFLAHLPASDPSGGNTANWFVSAAQEKALGLINPTSTEVDGEVGVSANFTYTFSQSGSVAPGRSISWAFSSTRSRTRSAATRRLGFSRRLISRPTIRRAASWT